jgi:hypothetical protein
MTSPTSSVPVHPNTSSVSPADSPADREQAVARVFGPVGVPLNLFKRRVLVYGFIFALGEGYLMVLFADLKWPRTLLFLSIASWGVLLDSGAWYRHQRRKGDAKTAQE